VGIDRLGGQVREWAKQLTGHEPKEQRWKQHQLRAIHDVSFKLLNGMSGLDKKFFISFGI
jgi:hypothetical protein